MWFKNLRLFRLAGPFTLTAEELDEKLAPAAFVPCGKQDLQRYGWVSPLGPEGQMLVHAAGGYMMISARRQEKILPAGVIKEQLEERLAQIQQDEGRPVGRKERDQLKDEIIFSLLPQAFTKSAVDYAYIDCRRGLIVVNSASANRAEILLSTLREALGSLPAVPLTPAQPATSVMTHWLQSGDLPADFTLGDECELRATSDERVIRGRRLDLHDDQLQQHLATGMYVKQLAIEWKEQIRCVLDENLACKRLKFADALLDSADADGSDTAAERFDQEFAIMTLELSAFIEALIQAFGGEAQHV